MRVTKEIKLKNWILSFVLSIEFKEMSLAFVISRELFAIILFFIGVGIERRKSA